MGISGDAVADYVDRALDSLIGIVVGLGDETANRRPDLAGANSPYVLLKHCVGVLEYWGGHEIAGRTVQRDRDAEFVASGPVAELAEAAQAAKRQFRADIAGMDPATLPGRDHPTMDPDGLELASKGHALLHVMEEMCQHLGQAEITRDLLRAGAAAPA